jgi:starch-binding outer membrane protein, SusD/RagB family
VCKSRFKFSSMKNFFIRYIPVILVILSYGCTKFVTINPPSTQLVSSTVFTSDATASAAVIGIYSNMMANTMGFYGGNVTLMAGLSADEFLNYSPSTDQSEFAENSLKPVNQVVKQSWGEPYQYIFSANAILEGLANSTGVSAPTAAELQGETKFIRALSYFYLVNLWGDVPLVLHTAYATNDTLHRSSSQTVYDQIIQDLKEAQSLLPDDYSIGGGERIRPNKSAATALLARVYLFNQNWSGAKEEADLVISNSLYAIVTDLSGVFLANSQEAIWQLQPVAPDVNTWEGYSFIMQDGPSSSPSQVALSDNLVNSFMAADLRKTNWIAIDSSQGTYSYYPFKYKIPAGSSLTEYYSVLRLAEQYLIRAEAEAHLNDPSSSIADINVIRNRANLPDLSSTLTADQCLDSIAVERRWELFAEWGNRWLDLKRTGQASTVLQPIKTDWQPTDTLYPIPQTEIQNDPNLTQNTGY